jgi:hypothetical protein
MKYKYIILCLCFLILPLNCACAASAVVVKSAPEQIEGSIGKNIKVHIFNGIRLTDIKVSDGRFKAPHTATEGLHEVLFFTRDGFYPGAVILKVSGETARMKIKSLRKMKDVNKGIVTGVVHKPVSGGKLKEHEGISMLFKNEKISFMRGNVSHQAVTNESGVFMIELAEGEYDISLESKKTGRAVVEKGKTTIKNVQKGMVLVD